jgi:hypothetical protein
VTHGAIEVIEGNGMYALTFHGQVGPKNLGTGPDLKSFVKNRLNSGMSSPELEAALQQLQAYGESHAWVFKAMNDKASVSQ